MSASSSAASSTLTRSKAAILVLTSFAAAYLIYYQHTSFYADEAYSTRRGSGSGLHRSNAIHRRRRQVRRNDTDEENTVQIPLENAPGEADARDSIVRPLGDGETVIDDQGNDDWDWSNEPPSQRNGQNIVQLLFRVSEDATRRNAYVHRGCQCNACGTVPIRGIRYRCSNCADFDLCESCEAQGLHTRTHIFYKVRIPTSSFAIRQMQPVWYPGDPDTCMRSLPRELITRLSKESGFDRPELDAYWDQWTFMANTEWREDPDELCLAMDRKTFDQCLVPSGGNRHAAPNLIHDRMFAFYDTNNDDLISFPEFINGLAYRKKKDKLKRVFEGFDINGDGYVDRKDFLRMFRSYYVMYKQMHRDMLEGLDDQVMNSTDAYQLLTSRQPLSSAFGRDGRFPPAPNPRTGEGKAPGVDGELEVADGKGVISDSSNDLGNREDVIIDAVVREYPNWPASTWAPTGGSAYWRAVTNPPETIDNLHHNVLEGLIRERQRMLRESSVLEVYRSEHSDRDPNELNDNSEDEILDRDWPPSFVTQVDVEAICGEGTSFAAVRPLRRPEVVEYALRRLRELSVNHQTLAVNEEIHERWKRRQFYTDEEEGAVAPPDWKEEEDLPYQNGKAVENSKEAAPPSRPISPRSRSSSKVRFVEDTDDFETRSNPSTSSRSVPERWGGMEIPDVEKDAGKEILYQVTQQACNELLDQLFKKREDFAVAALSSKKARDKFRPLFTNPAFEQWAVGMDKTFKKSKKKRANLQLQTQDHLKEPVTITEVGSPHVRELPLDDLLAVAGYSVNSEAGLSNSSTPLSSEVFQEDVAAESNIEGFPTELSTLIAEEIPALTLDSQAAGISEMALPTTPPEDSTPPSDDVPQEQLSGTYDGVSGNTMAADHLREEATGQLQTTQTNESYRDPTLPQFRPNSVPSTSLQGVVEVRPLFSLGDWHAETSPRRLRQSTWTDARTVNWDGTVTDDLGTEPPALDLATAAQQGPPPETVTIIQPPRSERRRAADDTSTDHSGKRGESDELLQIAKFEKSQFLLSKERSLASMSDDIRREFQCADWKVLYDLREMEAHEKQAKARGGWGRLNWEEFAQVVKGQETTPLPESSRKAMLDFLGSWIEFCIP